MKANAKTEGTFYLILGIIIFCMGCSLFSIFITGIISKRISTGFDVFFLILITLPLLLFGTASLYKGYRQIKKDQRINVADEIGQKIGYFLAKTGKKKSRIAYGTPLLLCIGSMTTFIIGIAQKDYSWFKWGGIIGLAAGAWTLFQAYRTKIKAQGNNDIDTKDDLTRKPERVNINKSAQIKKEIKDKIWDIVGPTNITLADPGKITRLGNVAVPTVIDILKNPIHQLGSANQAMLVCSLIDFAENGNNNAIDALSKVAEGKIPLVGPDGESAFNLASNFVSKKKGSNLKNIQTKTSIVEPQHARSPFYETVFNFFEKNPLAIGTLDDFRKGQKDFDSWGSGVLVGTKIWILNKLSAKLSEIGASSLNITKTQDYSWQTSELENFTARMQTGLPSGVLAGYYIGRIGDELFGLFGYGFNQDETEIPASPVVKSIQLTEQNDSERGISVLLVALRWDSNPIGKQELRNRAAKAVQIVDPQFDKDVMDVKILVVDEDQQYVQLSVRANFRDKAEEEQMREALKKEFVK